MNSPNSDLDEHLYFSTGRTSAPDLRVGSVPVWNPQALHELEAIGGEPLAAEVARQCVMDAEGHVQNIVGRSSDLAWRESAHALHGIALNVGALRLSNLLETMLSGQELTAEQWAAPLSKEIDDLRRALARRFP